MLEDSYAGIENLEALVLKLQKLCRRKCCMSKNPTSYVKLCGGRGTHCKLAVEQPAISGRSLMSICCWESLCRVYAHIYI